MTKLRDGYFRQVDSKVGDDNYLLKAKGGYIGLHTGRNNEANKVVRTDEYGYIQAGWINTISGNFTGTPDRIYASNDGYIRYITPANFFSDLSNSGNNISITVAGQNRTLTVGYASNTDTLDNLDSSYFLTCGMRNLIARNVYDSSIQGFRWTPGRIITQNTRRLSFSGGIYYSEPYRSEGPYGYYSVSFWYKVENYVSGNTISIDINDMGCGSIDVSNNKDWTFFSGGCKERTDSNRYGFLDFEGDFSGITLTVSDVVVVRGTNRSQTWFPAPEDLVDTYSNQTIGGTKTFSNEISGTITTATKLKTARKLWYQSFDGTADINGTISFTQGEEYGLLWKYDNTYTDARIYHATGVYQDHTKGDLNYDAGSWTSSDDIISHLFKVKSSINALAIMNSGKVGIGTITPQYSIDIVGHASIRSSSTAAYPTLWFHEYYNASTNWSARIVQDGYGASGLGTVTGYTHGMFFVGGRGGEYDNFIFSKHNGTPLFKIGYNSLNVNGIPMYTNANIYYTAENGGIYKMPRKRSDGGGWTWEFITLVDNADNAFFRIGGYGGSNDLNWIYLGVNTYADENMLRIKATSLSWGSYNILHAGNSYVNSSGKGYINNSEITYIDNSNKLDGLDSTDFLRYCGTNYGSTINNANNIATNLTAGIHKIHISNVEYSSILTGYDFNGSYWQLYFHPTSGYSEDIKYRASNCTLFKTILDSNNSSVSKSGETLSVKINGTTQSLTNTWRGIQNNLTSDSTTDSLSAAQGKALAGRLSTIEGDYLTRTTAQTVSGAKTFNVTKWILAGNEYNEITSKHWVEDTLYNMGDTAPIGNGWGIKNSIRFRWYSTYWVIGNIRGSSSNTEGFGICIENSDGTHHLNTFRITPGGEGYLGGNLIYHAGNLPAYPTQQSLGGPFLPLAGGTMDKKSLIQAASSNNDHQAGAIRIREYNYAGNSDNNNFNTHPENAPKIQFYWSGNNSVSLGSSGYEFFRMYSSTAVYKIWDEGNDGSGSGLDADKLDGYHLTDIYWADQKVQSGSLSNTTPTFGGITTNTFYATNGDATIKLYYYDHNDTNGAESVFIQSCFDAQNPLTSNYVTSYASRCYISLQPRGGRVGINMGTSRASYPLQVNGSIGATSIVNTTYNSSDKILMSDGSVLDKSTFAISGHTHSYLIDATQNGTFTNNVIPTNLTAGMHRVHRPGTDYISILHGYDFSGGYWQLVFQTSTWISPSITYRASNQTDFVTLLTSGNSSVSKSGETLTVKINGTEKSLTNTDTWRGIQNNLTSDSTTDSLSAAQGKALNGRLSTVEGDYLTRTTSQTVSGEKTFNDSKWVLASAEASEITNKADYIALYNASNTGYLWPNYSKVPSSIRFRWYSDYWRIGHVRSGGTPTGGFVIALESGDHLVDRFRLSSDGTGYLNGNTIITSGNWSSYITTSSVDYTIWRDISSNTDYKIQVVSSLPSSTNSNTFYIVV